MRNPTALSLLFLLAVSVQPALAGPTLTTLRDNGPADQRLDLVFTSDGYTADQRALFDRRVNRIVDTLFGGDVAVYQRYQAAFNVHVVWAPVAREGLSQHLCFHLPNQVMNGSKHSVLNLVRSAGVEPDAVVCLENPANGRSVSKGNVTFSIHDPQVVSHELGHVLAGLADEYEGVPCLWRPVTLPLIERLVRPLLSALHSYSFPNITAQTERSRIPWAYWIDANTPLPTPDSQGPAVGLYEGGFYLSRGFFRPQPDCLMRSGRGDFCKVCQEAVAIRLTQLCRPDLSVRRDGQDLVFEVQDGRASDLAIEWSLDGQPLAAAAGSRQLVLDPTQQAGVQEVRVLVRDATPMIRRAPAGALETSQAWTLQGAGMAQTVGTP